MRAAVGLAAVLAIKLTVVGQLKDHPLLQADAGLDTTMYVELARRVVDGNVSLAPGLYIVSPLYIYFLAVLLAIAQSLTFVRIVQAALGTVAVACVFVAAREWFGRPAAWFAAGLAALTGLFTFYEALILQAALDPLLTAGALAALAIALHRDRPAWGVLAGAVAGLQILNRPNAALAAGVLVLALLAIRRGRAAALVTAGLILALAPLSARNAIVTGSWMPVPSHGGLNFYIGNHEAADGTYREVPGITPNMLGQTEDARRVAEAALGRPLDDHQVSRYFYARGWAWIRSDPAAAAALLARKLHYTSSSAHLWLNYSYPFFAYDTPTLLALLVVGPWCLIPLGVVGLIVAAPRDRRREYVVWALFVPAYAVAVAVFFVAERYRLPLLVPMCIGTGALLARVYAALRTGDWRQAVLPLGAAAAMAIVVNWPLRLDEGRAEQRVRMVERLITSGREGEVSAWIDRALSDHPTPGVAHFRVGRAWLARGHKDAALRHLTEAVRIDPDRPETSFALGQALLDAGRAADAVPHLQRAFDAGVRRDLAGVDLARALAASGRDDEARRLLRTVAPARSVDAASWHALGALAEQLDDPGHAVVCYTRAIAADPGAIEPRRRLGLLHAEARRWLEAAAAFEGLVAAAPRDASAHLNLAVAYTQLGRLDDARRHAREALRLQPGYQQATELLRIIR